MAEPGVNLVGQGLSVFGWLVAPELMALSECGASGKQCNAMGTAIAMVAHVPGASSVQPFVRNTKLRNFLNMFNRTGTGIGSGSTADAIRYELETGQAVGGKVHFQKGMEMRSGLLSLIRSGKLDASDQTVAKQLLTDIQDAMSTPGK